MTRTIYQLVSADSAVTRVYCGSNFGGLSGFGQTFGQQGNGAPARCHRGCTHAHFEVWGVVLGWFTG